MESTFTDPRDGKTYKLVKIGKQVWMAENLAYSNYADFVKNVNSAGCMYNWEDAMLVCPEGWHLPTNEEWQELVDFCGGFFHAGKVLKDNKGFSALLAGYGHTGYGTKATTLTYENVIGQWWTATAANCNCAVARSMSSTVDYVYSANYDRHFANSVRCVKDN
ncbi:MAG: hypothetical protein FWF63_04560 [Fibromonadales bacterium]|nr:hypothetical protein [Fibromonadales bacterium]